MRSSMACASLLLLLLLLATKSAHGIRRLDMELHAALENEEDIPDSKWRQPPPGDTRRASGGRHGLGSTTWSEHLTSTARAAAQEQDGEVKKTMREVAPRLIHEDYVGPSGHSPNHHHTIPCGPC